MEPSDSLAKLGGRLVGIFEHFTLGWLNLVFCLLFPLLALQVKCLRVRIVRLDKILQSLFLHFQLTEVVLSELLLLFHQHRLVSPF